MAHILDKVFGTHSERQLKKMKSTVEKIEALESTMQELTDEELRAKTDEFKERLNNGETLEDILPEAYAVVREASVRTLGLRHFPVQLMGGIVLNNGSIAEMRTGEGKTLVATLPSYLNALTGEGVHVVTVNDYLAQRDSETMGQIHEFLGLTVGCVLNDMRPDERREAYDCDITYITNNELGFDYLRDNMAIYKENLVQRGLKFAIIDEVDSILIDEARTPLIISGEGDKSTRLYEMCNMLVKTLEKGESSGELSKLDAIMGEGIKETGDFVVNRKDKNVSLTEDGVKKVEKYFGIENLADPENIEIQHGVIVALKAHNLMFKDQDYVVDENNEVMIVDEFTGRIMPGRRYSDGLHQAIEAKEGVKIQDESKTLATITFQNLFNKYEKKSGMTGTALTEEKEFIDIYNLDVVAIPTNEPVIRDDQNDSVYKTKEAKYKAVIEDIKECHKKGQPVLVGTITIETSELLSKMLKKAGIKHNVLNAKYHAQEAEIVAKAGQHGAVTIATNMAGRGTDIVLDDEARAAGGLKIIGTERHESRRIDNQLRGRSGRQGDPGESKFYISLEDDLMKYFASEKLIDIFTALKIDENRAIEHKMLSSSVEKAQKKIEGNNFGIRKNLLDYDKVMNEQRELIYDERRQVLDGENMKDPIINMFRKYVDKLVAIHANHQFYEEWDLEGLNNELKLAFRFTITEEDIKDLTSEKLSDFLYDKIVRNYNKKEEEFLEPEHLREIERVILLRNIDEKWMNHIDDMDHLKQGIGLQAYGQKDPVVEYRQIGYDMFEEMAESIAEDTVKMLYNIKIEQRVERKEVAKVTGTNMDDSVKKTPVKRTSEKIGRNEPCPCGSGKKYKKCCGA